MIAKIACLIVVLFLSASHAKANPSVAQKFSLLEGGHEIRIEMEGGQTSTCRLPFRADIAQSSSDGEALIVSDTEYVLVKDLLRCWGIRLEKNRIPDKVGTLVDINIKKGIYLTVDPISTSPLSFLATVARLGSSRGLTTIPGSYVKSYSVKKLQRFGFSYDETRARGRFSVNGNYVSPNGEIDCSRDAYPGVWDIARNRKVIAPHDVQVWGSDATRKWCDVLFFGESK